jgi:hypothetical protein
MLAGSSHELGVSGADVETVDFDLLINTFEGNVMRL